jgi:hypothetical protein
MTHQLAYLGTANLTIFFFLDHQTRNTTTSLPYFVLYVRTPCDTDISTWLFHAGLAKWTFTDLANIGDKLTVWAIN